MEEIVFHHALPIQLRFNDVDKFGHVCKSIMVTFDLEKHESMPLTEDWIEAICKFEGKDVRKKKN